MKLGILALARPTFDVAFAEEKLGSMLNALSAAGHEIAGPKNLLLDDAAVDAGIADLRDAAVEQVLILQVTFTDASMAVAIGEVFDQPISIWAIPEPRIGGRLRLNSFCGLNLAAHALGLKGRVFSWIYADPDTVIDADLVALFSGERQVNIPEVADVPEPTPTGETIARNVKGKNIARIGEHPTGFDTCDYDPIVLRKLAGVEVAILQLNDLFESAREVPDETAVSLKAEVEQQLSGLDEVNQPELNRSLKLKIALEKLREEQSYDAFAIRCWPETFMEYGGAVCGPAAMMGEAKVPCACEADVYGALTQLILMEAAQAPVFLTDLVDMDANDNTGVVWHCGQAPWSMRDPDSVAEAAIHTNRKQPLLYQFTLKPGPVTFLRISQSFGQPKMVLALGEMLQRPMSFTGTSGVVIFERPVDEVTQDIIGGGLEHHMALAYGDHREALRGTAGSLGLPILEL